MIRNDNGLWVDENNRCVGYLFNFDGRGIFSPDGKVDISKADAEIHNKLLSEGEVLGLDQNCKIGMSGTFYYNRIKGQVTTFMGDLVSTLVRVNGKSIIFHRGEKIFRGVLPKDADCFNFKRIK